MKEITQISPSFIVQSSNNNRTYGDQRMLIDKINELITVLNELQKQVSTLQGQVYQ